MQFYKTQEQGVGRTHVSHRWAGCIALGRSIGQMDLLSHRTNKRCTNLGVIRGPRECGFPFGFPLNLKVKKAPSGKSKTHTHMHFGDPLADIISIGIYVRQPCLEYYPSFGTYVNQLFGGRNTLRFIAVLALVFRVLFLLNRKEHTRPLFHIGESGFSSSLSPLLLKLFGNLKPSDEWDVRFGKLRARPMPPHKCTIAAMGWKS